MGGQACIFYGAAEFSRDADVIVLAEPDNLKRLSSALEDLQANCIAIPSFAIEYLKQGHAIHFRCRHPDAEGISHRINSFASRHLSIHACLARYSSTRANCVVEIDSDLLVK